MKIDLKHDERSGLWWITSEKGHSIPLTFDELEKLKEDSIQLVSEHLQKDLDLGAFGCGGGGCII